MDTGVKRKDANNDPAFLTSINEGASADVCHGRIHVLVADGGGGGVGGGA